MKFKLVLTLCMLLCAVTYAETPVGSFSVGYQSMIVGEFLQGLSMRTWLTEASGIEINLFHAYADVDIEGDSEDATLLALEGKYMQSLKTGENSKFYAGASAGFGQVSVSVYDDSDLDVYWIRPLVGTEWFFSEIPEIGFNFDVGYSLAFGSVEDTDISLFGIGANFGAHYYFN